MYYSMNPLDKKVLRTPGQTVHLWVGMDIKWNSPIRGQNFTKGKAMDMKGVVSI